MQSERICRTCNVSGSIETFKLNTRPKKYHGKILSDLLTEVTNIDVKMEYIDKFPQCICRICDRKLKNAYDFVIQARDAYEEMLNYFNQNKDIQSKTECLREIPFEVCTAQSNELNLKEEPCEIESCNEKNDDESLDPLVMNEIVKNSELDKLQLNQQSEKVNETTSSSSAVDKRNRRWRLGKINLSEQQNQQTKKVCPEQLVEVQFKKEPCEESITENPSHLEKDIELSDNSLDSESVKNVKRQKKETSNANESTNSTVSDGERSFKCDQCEKSYRWKRNLIVHKRSHLDKNKWVSCLHCKRKFMHKESYISHLKKNHEEEWKALKISATLSEQRQCKSVSINLCQPNGCKLIQCMICLQKYTKINDLRNHLNEHPDISSFAERPNETIQEIADGFLIDCKDLTEEMLITRIHKDLSVKKFDKFYSITNQSGYELSLSSSESESDYDIESEHTSKVISNRNYDCELCEEKFTRKYQVFYHQREQHEWKDAVHVCRRCDARFVNKLLLEHHYKSQCRNSQKRFKCRKCPLRYRWKHNLVTHYREHKKNKETVQCSECNRTYDDKKSLTIHMLKIHADDSKMLVCHWCNRTFYRRDYMLKHLKRHGIGEKDLPLAEMLVLATSKPHGDKIIKCKICYLEFERINELKVHILLELKLNLSRHQNYESLTNYSITNGSGFELHLDDSETDDEDSVESKPMSYKCEVCQLQCKRKFEMFQHQRSMHRFEQLPHSCEKCIFRCVSKDILDHHRSTQCFNEQKKLSCEKCSYKFMWPENLTRHMLLQHPVEPESKITPLESNISNLTDTSVRNIDGETAPIAQLQCPHCDRIYVQQSRLNNHIRDVHIKGDRKKKEAERKFLCSLCGKESQSARDLDIHMRRHTGEKPFKCDMCEMAFPRNCEMMQHRRKHTGEKPYHCTVCGKDFARSDKLKRHMLTHSGLKPYKCTFCEKCYRQSKDLKIHLLQHTG